MNASQPTRDDIVRFLSELKRDGRLTAADIAILKAHACLPNRTGENWQIAEAAAGSVIAQLSRDYTDQVKEAVPRWNQPPSWHAVDCLQRWLGYAFAREWPYYLSLIETEIREDGTRRWWMALGEAATVIGSKNIAVQLRSEIAEALESL